MLQAIYIVYLEHCFKECLCMFTNSVMIKNISNYVNTVSLLFIWSFVKVCLTQNKTYLFCGSWSAVQLTLVFGFSDSYSLQEQKNNQWFKIGYTSAIGDCQVRKRNLKTSINIALYDFIKKNQDPSHFPLPNPETATSEADQHV